MSAGDVRRVELLVRVFVEHASGEVLEHSLAQTWTNHDECMARLSRGQGLGGSSMPMESHEPFRMMRSELYGHFDRIVLQLGEAVSRVRAELA